MNFKWEFQDDFCDFGTHAVFLYDGKPVIRKKVGELLALFYIEFGSGKLLRHSEAINPELLEDTGLFVETAQAVFTPDLLKRKLKGE